MVIKGLIKKGEYYDSVTLMRAVKRVNELSGVIDSAIVMGTKENRSILEASGLMLDQFRTCIDSDLLIVVKTENDAGADKVLEEVKSVLKSVRKRDNSDSTPLPRSMDAAVKIIPDANLVLISVAGKYAGDVAMKALQRGMHVMLFSDNVPLEQEIDLKRYAVSQGLLVMGPDCGTAIINGVQLAFANVVNRGDIGIVAAAGTGLQEVSCLISNAGAGISQAIGTGGRDVKKEVGGLMFIESMRMLSYDEHTKIILLVSKPPHPEVLEKIGSVVKEIRKPVVAAFLGVKADYLKKYGIIPAGSLEEAALFSVALSSGKKIGDIQNTFGKRKEAIKDIAKPEAGKLQPGQKYIRGLFSGGTFCYEAQLFLMDMVEGIYSNAPTGKSLKLENSLQSQKHTLIDLGEDEFTVGRPHPMIDFSLRDKRLIEEAKDAETAVILLDIVLGYGSNPDPLKEIIPAIKKAQQTAVEGGRHLPFICSVTGTNADPQNRSKVMKGLRDAGVLVMESNAAASTLAGFIAASVHEKKLR
jgi:succinyl-CoA synthetase alpha subunit